MALFSLYNRQQDCYVKAIANGNFEATQSDVEAGEFTIEELWPNRGLFGNNWELVELHTPPTFSLHNRQMDMKVKHLNEIGGATLTDERVEIKAFTPQELLAAGARLGAYANDYTVEVTPPAGGDRPEKPVNP